MVEAAAQGRLACADRARGGPHREPGRGAQPRRADPGHHRGPCEARRDFEGNRLFGKATCPHCVRAKGYLEEAGIDYAYHDVVREPGALYEMLARVKPIVGPKTPITVPQIWIDGAYVGGADALAEIVEREVEPNPDRGQCSISPGRLGSAKRAA